MKPSNRLLLTVLVGGAIIAGSAVSFWRYMYPFGKVHGGVSLPGLRGTLLAYAGDHDGWYPGGTNSYQALQKLLSYCPSGRELAGISGDKDATATALRQGWALDAHLSSWVYVPGFRKDDPDDLALIWESRPGLNFDGRRNFDGGRPVLLVGGLITNIPGSLWDAFLQDQDRLRTRVQLERDGRTNDHMSK